MKPKKVPNHTRKLAMQMISRDALRVNQAPLDSSQARDLAIFAWQALDAIPAGRGTEQDIANLETVCNVSVALCRMDYGMDAIQTAKDGLIASGDVRRRFEHTGRVGVNAGELNAIRAAIGIYDEQMHLGVKVGEMKYVLSVIQRRSATYLGAGVMEKAFELL